MGVHSLFVFTHDSVGLGEDGPTHQPIEHLMAAGGAEADGFSSGGRERDCGVLAAGAGAEGAELHGAEPAGPAGARCGADVCGRAKGAYSMTPEVTKPDVIDRDGLRGDDVPEGGGGAEDCRHHGAGGFDAELQDFDEQTEEYKAELLPEACRRCRLRRARRWDGGSMSA